MTVEKLLNNSKLYSFIFFVVSFSQGICQNVPDSLRNMTYSGQELYQKSCEDTLRFLIFKKKFDLGVIFPSWQPFRDDLNFTVIEGYVSRPETHNDLRGPHISEEDFPNYHYSHDFCVNVLPDKPYEYLRCYYQMPDSSWGCRKHVHCEWELGMGSGNETNPLKDEMRKGNSAGFLSYGHKRKEPLEHLPTVGDWVHLEGIGVWDRGHPPAKTEIHPIHFMFVKRHNPEIFQNHEVTRIDVFASADGSAFYNQLPTAPEYVNRVEMSQKDYEIAIPNDFKTQNLKIEIFNRSGHSEELKTHYIITTDSIFFKIPWKSINASNLSKLSQKILIYHPKEPQNQDFQQVVVKIHEIHRKKMLDFLRKPQLRVFANLNQNYYFVNEFGPSEDILNEGWGKTSKRKWKNIEIADTFWIPKDSVFRVQFSAWEADGVDLVMGEILNQNCNCDPEVKKIMKNRLMDFTPVGKHGCKDDILGEGFRYHKSSDIHKKTFFELYTDGKNDGDPCPFGGVNPHKALKMKYSIEILSPK